MKRTLLLMAIAAGIGFGAAHMVPTTQASILPLVQQMSVGQVAITDTEAIRITNEVVRPVSEDLRRLYYQLLSVKNTYASQINTLFPAGGGTIEDGRESEGVSRLVSDDARQILLFANTYITAYETEGTAAMTKACVQQLEVQ